MSERTWKWFKHGKPFDIEAKYKAVNGATRIAKITVFVETTDKQEARREALKELQRYGYNNIQICKVTPR